MTGCVGGAVAGVVSGGVWFMAAGGARGRGWILYACTLSGLCTPVKYVFGQ